MPGDIAATLIGGSVLRRHGGEPSRRVFGSLGLSTRLYFDDEDAANAEDPVLNMVEPRERRRTLLAKREARPGGAAAYVFDVRLQGPDETVFFDI